MVTCKVDSAVPKMSGRGRKSSSNSSGFRLLDGDQLDTASSVSRNSIYKLKIDLMFDDTRSIRSNLDDRRGSQRTRSIIMYGRSELASTGAGSNHSLLDDKNNKSNKILAEAVKKDVRRISNSVQAQIERMFTDVAKDASCSFNVTCLGSLPLKDKVTSLQGLQGPLRELYLNENGNGKPTGSLDICANGLRVKASANCDTEITPFHNIAVWSAVKFVISEDDGGAAFLPLITDPDNIDKSTLFQPLTTSDQRRISSAQHAPIFAVVMRSADMPKLLECHGYLCHSTEDAIVIAATLYQSLMAHVSTNNSHRSTKRRTPRNQNGVSCISIASSSALTGSNYLARSSGGSLSTGQKSSARSSPRALPPIPNRSGRKKRTATSSLSGESDDILRGAAETTTEERKRKSHKTKRAPPIPSAIHGNKNSNANSPISNTTNSDLCCDSSISCSDNQTNVRVKNASQTTDSLYRTRGETNGDILTRVAIPRSGSFLNTGGLTRYKSRAARRHSGKSCGGGGSPLGFSELFNEFRLHENLHSLDDILYAIIDADGMSFNDLKPIYKEFLLKLAVTLTKDELYQRSKNIMRRQKKKKLKRRNSSGQKKSRPLTFGTKGLKKVFQLTQFSSCRGKQSKSNRGRETPTKTTTINQQNSKDQTRNRVTTSGSDVSVVRHENTLAGLNRNSSSGYVSCSECSYDSESCTCISADRCYCSLGADHDCANKKLKKNGGKNRSKHQLQSRKICVDKQSSHNQNINNKKVVHHHIQQKPHQNQQQQQQIQSQYQHQHQQQQQQQQQQLTPSSNRHSLASCKTEDKCYCSLVETNNEDDDDDNDVDDDGDDNDAGIEDDDNTTWCDTDSCLSASKCYCRRPQSRRDSLDSDSVRSKPHRKQSKAKMGLDYELFTISGKGKAVNSHDALSVKKSVEAAAIFADVKLSQTTDIKSLCDQKQHMNDKINKHNTKRGTSIVEGTDGGNISGDTHSNSNSSKKFDKRRESISIDRQHSKKSLMPISPPSLKSSSADDLLSKLSAMEKIGHSIKYKQNKKGSKEITNYYHQTTRIINAPIYGGSTLEDTLGYLP